MNRRDTLLALLAMGASSASRHGHAQKPAAKIPVLGILNPDLRPTPEQIAQRANNPVPRRFRERGWVAGQNIRFELAYAEGREERLPELAAALVEKRVDVIWAFGSEAAVAAARATKTIPIVFWAPAAVELGLVDSLARPGRNVTGVGLESDIIPKQLELLKQIVPGARRVANISVPSQFRTVSGGQHDNRQVIDAAARKLRIDVQHYPVERAADFDPVFRKILAARTQAMRVAGSFLTSRERDRILEFARRNRIPGMYYYRTWVEAGGLVAYAADSESGILQSLTYVDRILRGAKPADLPVEQDNRIELSVNLKTARALGLTIPQSVLIRANKVIE